VKNQFLQIKVFAKTLASEKKSIINTKSHFKKSHKLTKFLFNESLQVKDQPNNQRPLLTGAGYLSV